MLHVSLQVEVGKLVVLVNLEQLGKLGIRVDSATVLLILQVMCLDVGIDLLADLSAGHLSSDGLAEEGSKLVADKGGLHKARWLSVHVAAALLDGSLGSSLHLARDDLLKGLEIALDGGEETDQLVQLSGELVHLRNHG